MKNKMNRKTVDQEVQVNEWDLIAQSSRREKHVVIGKTGQTREKGWDMNAVYQTAQPNCIPEANSFLENIDQYSGNSSMYFNEQSKYLFLLFFRKWEKPIKKEFEIRLKED
jgi:Holliday junction resolvase-like predicted endonuclease